MTTLDPCADDESTDDLLDATFPAALLLGVAAWLPAAVFLLGDSVRVLRAELAGDDDLPSLADVRGLGMTGLRAAVPLVVFQLPALCCLGLVFVCWLVVDRGRFHGDALGLVLADPLAFANLTVLSPASGSLVAGGLVLTAIVAVLAGYVGSVSLVTFAATDRLAPAFDPDTLLAGARSSRFRRGYLLAVVLCFVGSGAAWLVTLVPVVGPFAAAFVELFALVGALRVVTDGYDVPIVDREGIPPRAGGRGATRASDA
jgi:hypothetical protein